MAKRYARVDQGEAKGKSSRQTHQSPTVMTGESMREHVTCDIAWQTIGQGHRHAHHNANCGRREVDTSGR